MAFGSSVYLLAFDKVDLLTLAVEEFYDKKGLFSKALWELGERY